MLTFSTGASRHSRLQHGPNHIAGLRRAGHALHGYGPDALPQQLQFPQRRLLGDWSLPVHPQLARY